MDDFAAGGALGGFVAGDIVGVVDVDDAGAGDAFVGLEFEGAAADHFGDGFVGVAVGDAGGHDGAHRGGVVAERVGQQGEGGFEADLDGAVVGGGDFLDAGHEGLAETVALAPAGDGGGGVTGEDALAVMEFEAGAEGEFPGFAVVFDNVAFDHLRADAVVVVLAVKGVEHHEAVVAGLVGGGDDGVDDGEVGIGDEAQRLGGLGVADAGRGEGGGGGEQGAAAHGRVPPGGLRGG